MMETTFLKVCLFSYMRMRPAALCDFHFMICFVKHRKYPMNLLEKINLVEQATESLITGLLGLFFLLLFLGNLSSWSSLGGGCSCG